MQVAPDLEPRVTRHVTPAWLWVPLLAGAVGMVGWGWFIFGFTSEPSAIGRILAVLVTWIALSLVSAVAGTVGAIELLRHGSSGRALAWIAAVAMTLTGVGAVAGIPALIGLMSSRKADRP